MRQAEKKNQKDKIAIALVLCFCVIALTSIFTIKSNIEKINGSNTNVPVSEKTQTDENTNNSSNSMSEASGSGSQDNEVTESSVNVPTIDSQDSNNSDTLSDAFVNPVKCENASITNDYSMDSLIYSVTLDQYMTHSGIDIEAPKDTQVLASNDGTVTAIYEDGRYGNSIEITHTNGFITVYSNLSDAHIVEVGDTVERGQIISGIGSSGLFESLEPPHLHFEMLKDGVYVNPIDYVQF